MFDYAKNIKRLQIEITNMCNAYCPGCARNLQGGQLIDSVTPGIMEMDIWKTLISNKNMEHIESISFNGAFGDPLMHSNILEMLQHLYIVKPSVAVTIFSNGSMRKETFFTELAHKLKQFYQHDLIFSIDGLADTNHLYRRNTDFNKIINHAKTFTKAGGSLEWWMIVFEHNKHQIIQAKQMAKELGCRKFALRKSYEKRLKAIKHLKFSESEMISPDYSEVERLIDLHNTDFKKDELIGEVNEDSMAHTNDKMSTRKECPWAVKTMIQVDHLGNIWPCCYVAEHQLNGESPEWHSTHLISKYGIDHNNIMHKTLETILDDVFFQQYVNESWSNNATSQLCKKCLGQ
jgi:MoaA/NifB/PqqE/SkfB family radical SAM enzyme